MNNRSVPVDTLMPHVVYRSLPDACAWLKRVFNFKEHFRYGDPVGGMQLYLGKAYIMLTGPREWAASPASLGYGTQTLTVLLEDVDAHYARTMQEGAAIVEELHDTVYGERQYAAEELDGHRWIFSQHVRDLSPDDWGATIAST